MFQLNLECWIEFFSRHDICQFEIVSYIFIQAKNSSPVRSVTCQRGARGGTGF